ATGRMRQISKGDTNIWEAVWCGNETIAAVVSPGPGEGLWYTARLALIDTEGGASRDIFTPQDQLGWPSASPSGRHIAVVEALCSDRWLVAGDLRLIDTRTREVRKVATGGIDVTHTEWRSDRHLLLAGHRGFETVVALYDAQAGELEELWQSEQITTSGFYSTVAGFAEPGDCALIGEGFTRPPEIAVIRRGKYQAVKSFDPGAEEAFSVLGGVDTVKWQAPDGLEIQGLLLKPSGPAPYPLVLNVHGGPVWHYRPYWLGRRSIGTLMMLKR